MSIQIEDLVKKCIESESGYRQQSEVLSDFTLDSKNIKHSQKLVDAIKVSIKNKRLPAHQKLYAIKLLNKCVMKGNKDFIKYVEKKILSRLGILAEFNKEKTSAQDLSTKGDNIFSPTETDKKSASGFLMVLLDSIERWASSYQQYDDGKYTQMFKTYNNLVTKGVKFPSKFKNERAKSSNPNNRNNSPNRIIQNNNQPIKKSQADDSRIANSEYQSGSMRQVNLKKADDLKKNMLRVKEFSKKGVTYITNLEKKGFEYDRKEMIQMDKVLQEGKELCENCIQELMTEEMVQLISNSGELLDKMITYQDQLMTSIVVIQPHVEEIQKIDGTFVPASQKNNYQTTVNKVQTKKLPGPKINSGLLDIDFGQFNAPQPQQNFGTSVQPQNQNNQFYGNFSNFNNNNAIEQPQSLQVNFKQEENKDDNQEEGDLWSQLDQYAGQFQTQQLQNNQNVQPQPIVPNLNNLNLGSLYQQNPNQLNIPSPQIIQEQQQSPQKQSFKLHEIANQQDPFEDAVKQNQVQQQQQLQIEYQQQDNNYFNNVPQEQQQQQQQQYNQQQQNNNQDYYNYNQRSNEKNNGQNLYEQQHINIDSVQNNHEQYQNTEEIEEQNQSEPTEHFKQQKEVGPGQLAYRLWDDNIHQEFNGNPFGSQDKSKENGNNVELQNQLNRKNERIKDLEKEVERLKQYNGDLNLDIKILKEKVNSMMYYDNGNQNISSTDSKQQELQLQIQNLETSQENMRKYYEKEILVKDAKLEDKDRIIQNLKLEIQNIKKPNNDTQFNNGSEQKYQSNISNNIVKTDIQQNDINDLLDINGNGNDNSNSNQSSSSKKMYIRINKPKSEQNKKEEEKQPQINKISDFDSNENKSIQNAESLNQSARNYNSNNSQEINQNKSKTEEIDKKQLILRQIDNIFFKSLFTDKGLIYEDMNVQIGCMRSVSIEWRLATFKVFIGNKSDSQEITNFQIKSDNQCVTIKDEAPLSILPKQQFEMKILVSAQILGTPLISLQYSFGEKKSGTLIIKLPVNTIFFADPHPMMAAYFKLIWEQYRNEKIAVFDLDLQRASNLKQLAKIATLEGNHGTHITQVDQQQNIIAFASYHLEGQVLMKIELSQTGKNCKISVKADGQGELPQGYLTSILDIIEAKI